VQHSYVVVLASHVARANAETFVKQLHLQGHTEARIIERKGIVCVVYGNYGTQGEAYQAANKLHSNKELKQAWVMELKN
ncbi:SPOR domain-containing protein, partial [Mesomycoplasma ovipneumoniae]|uniref:SPOR domain-containing protein n=1 Tax=Mesomycoplasma ovipneumoniae TaxID=29562 RepID=UPI00311A1FC3